MKDKKYINCLFVASFVLLFAIVFPPISYVNAMEDAVSDDEWAEENDLFGDEENGVSDPLEPLNRAFFQFNDKMYFWVLKPVATGYRNVVAEDIRLCVRDFFHNLTSPIRIVNSLLQGKVKESGVEVARLVINSTVGIVGLADPAKREFGLTNSNEEDFGQTLGRYGVGDGIYFCWPFLGPSNVRDTIGLVGDIFLNPISYMAADNFAAGLGANAGERVNHTSLSLGDYEQFKESSFDPYLAMRDAYRQHRKSKINDSAGQSDKSYYSGVVEQEIKTSIYSSSGTQESTEQTGLQKSLKRKDFFVHLGAYVDIENVKKVQEKLRSLNKEGNIMKYDRGDYIFYSIEVPAGSDFMQAKKEEEKLQGLGFSETFVIANR